jgi:hypothetical protein
MPDDPDIGNSLCPSCEQWIPSDRIALHLDGLDGARPECPRQDLALIVQHARVSNERQQLPLVRLMREERLW